MGGQAGYAMIAALKRRIAREQYLPTAFGLLVNPYYHARRALLEAVKSGAPAIAGRVLDIGCGQKPYEAYFVAATSYVGLEYDTEENRARKKADFFYRGGVFPFPDASFDSAVCSQVLEHVFTPEAFLAEANRVLKPGAPFLLTLPFVWDEHEQPHDFARYSSFGIAALLERNGFEVLRQEKTLADLRVIFQLVNAYLYKCLMGRNAYLNVAYCILLMAPFNLMGSLLARVAPGNGDLYLDNIVLARKVRSLQ
jgi:SAM-dependent methyltransferase